MMQIPITRRDCAPGGACYARPCPYACRWRNEDGSCVLEIADEGGASLSEVGEHMGVCRERVRQIQDGALRKLRVRARKFGLSAADIDSMFGVRPAHALDFGSDVDSRRRERWKLRVYDERHRQKQAAR
jgi:ribosomal protein L13E